MSVEILCQSDQRISQKAVIEFIEDGVYFESSPHFSPSLSNNEVDSEDWNMLEIYYQANKRPILIERLTKDSESFTVILEEKELLVNGSGEETSDRIIEAIINTKQIFCFQFNEHGIDENAWEMLDSLEAYLSKRLRGLIFVDDGVFDERLHRILEY